MPICLCVCVCVCVCVRHAHLSMCVCVHACMFVLQYNTTVSNLSTPAVPSCVPHKTIQVYINNLKCHHLLLNRLLSQPRQGLCSPFSQTPSSSHLIFLIYNMANHNTTYTHKHRHHTCTSTHKYTPLQLPLVHHSTWSLTSSMRTNYLTHINTRKSYTTHVHL